MEKEQLNQMDLNSLIHYYKKHKYRKCNGFFDAKIRGSVNRTIVNRLKSYFNMTNDQVEKIDQDIDKQIGKV